MLVISSELTPNYHKGIKGINRLPQDLLGGGWQEREGVMFLILSFVILVVLLSDGLYYRGRLD